jgi:hypothetical protein
MVEVYIGIGLFMVCCLCIISGDDCCVELCNNSQDNVEKNETESPMQTIEI